MYDHNLQRPTTFRVGDVEAIVCGESEWWHGRYLVWKPGEKNGGTWGEVGELDGEVDEPYRNYNRLFIISHVLHGTGIFTY